MPVSFLERKEDAAKSKKGALASCRFLRKQRVFLVFQNIFLCFNPKEKVARFHQRTYFWLWCDDINLFSFCGFCHIASIQILWSFLNLVSCNYTIWSNTEKYKYTKIALYKFSPTVEIVLIHVSILYRIIIIIIMIINITRQDT